MAPPTAPEPPAAAAARIYMGGLTPDVAPADVINRMRPFGEVLACELIPSKAAAAADGGSSNAPRGAPAACRGFAYVTLLPKDDVSLSRMFSLYNGCKWRGQRLRVELAQPHYLARLQQEAAAAAAAEEQAERERAEQEQQQHRPPAADGDGDAHLLRLPVPGPKHKHLTVDLTAKHKSHRTWFPAAREKRLAELSWESLGPSKRVALQAAADAADSLPRAKKHQQHQQQLPVEQQEQRQQHTTAAATSAAAAAGRCGATVPFEYASQPPQQQQQPAAKGSAKIVAQELVGQLKLLKRIADKERQQQHQQRRGRAAPGVVDFSDATAVPGGDDPGAGAASLDRFADSDSEGEQHTARGPASGMLVPVVKQQQQQADKQQQQRQPKQQQRHAAIDDDGDSPVLSASSDLDSDYGSDAWQQWLAAEGIADDEPEVQQPPTQPAPVSKQPMQPPRPAQQPQPKKQPARQQRAPPKQRTAELLVPAASVRPVGAADLDRFASDSE